MRRSSISTFIMTTDAMSKVWEIKRSLPTAHYAAIAHAMGGVSGQAQIVERLMARGKDLLLYPGGAYESIKPPEARYQLQWKTRYGFVRLAAAAGYTIVPVASVGPDEYYDHAISSEALLHSPLVKYLMKLGVVPADLRADLVPPIPDGSMGKPSTQAKDNLLRDW
jgi:hypothetical protein